jgi:hypothetical protein
MERDADVVVVGAGIGFRFSRFAEGAVGKPRNVL